MRFLLVSLCLGASGASAKVYECRDAAGKVRYTNRRCADAEAEKEVPLVSNSPLPGEKEPVARDPREPVTAAPGTKTLLIEASPFVETYEKGKGWRALRPVRESSKAALRRAVESFNAVGGLRLKLEYAEATDSLASMAQAEKANKAGRFIAHWADFPGVPLPQRPWSIGCFPYYRQKDGKVVSWCDPRRGAGESLGGAWLQLVEGGDHPPCGAENEAYYALTTLADCLGLEHNKDKSSVMGGACRTSYAPADAEAFRRLYGR